MANKKHDNKKQYLKETTAACLTRGITLAVYQICLTQHLNKYK